MNIGVGISTSRAGEGWRVIDCRLVLAIHTEDAELLAEGVIDASVTLVVVDCAARERRKVVRIRSGGVRGGPVGRSRQSRQHGLSEGRLCAQWNHTVGVNLSGNRVL